MWPLVGLLCIFVYFSPIIFGQKMFLSDGQYGAYFEASAFWSRYWAGGWPVMADVVSMPLYPVRLAMMALGFSFDAFVVAAYLIAFLGTFLLFRRRVEPGPACIGALVFILSGWMQSHLPHTSMIHTAVWLPWMLWGFELIASSNKHESWFGPLVLAAATFMSCTAGHLQITLYSMLLVTAYGIFLSIRPTRLRLLLTGFAAILCGVALAAPSLIPTLELSSHTFRAQLDAKTIFDYSFPINELPSLVLPLVFGASPYGWFGEAYIGPGNMGETLTAVPAIVLALVLVSIFAKGARRSYIFFWLSVLFFSICFSLGNAIQPFGWITEFTPILNRFRAPSRHLLETSIALGALSALGTQALLGRLEFGEVIKVIVSLSVLTVLAVISTVLFYANVGQILGHVPNPLINYSFIAAILLLLTTAICILVISNKEYRTNKILIIIGLIFSFQTAIVGYQFPWRVYAPDNRYLDERDWSHRFRSLIGSDYRVLAMDGYEAQVFNPDQSRVDQLRTLGWYGPLLNRSMAELSGLTTGGWTRREVLLPSSQALDLLSVRYVSINERDRHLLDANPQRWKFLQAYGNELVYENLFALPRARVVCDLYFINDASKILEAIYYQNTSQISLNRNALILGTAGANSAGSDECNGTATIEKETAGGLIIVARTSAPSYLVISDTWYPGWSASVNGKPQEVMLVNHALRAVPLEAGGNVVKLNFVPQKFWASLAITFLACVMLFVLVRRKPA